MNRNKMNIKMDLLRAAKSALEVKSEFDPKLSETFLNKAKEEFQFIKDEERLLEKDLEVHCNQINDIKSDPLKRLQWGEKILTIASRLSEN